MPRRLGKFVIIGAIVAVALSACGGPDEEGGGGGAQGTAMGAARGNRGVEGVGGSGGEVQGRYDTATAALLVRVPASALPALAALPGVAAVQPAPRVVADLVDSADESTCGPPCCREMAPAAW